MAVQGLARALPTGLRRRLIFLVVASVVPFLLLIGLVARRHLLDQKPLAAERAVARTQQITERLNHELGDIDAVMHTAMASVGASSRDRPANDSMLRRLAMQLPDDFPHWVVYTDSGQVIGSSSPDAGPLEPAYVQSLWESKPAAAGSFVTEPIDTPRSGYVVHVMLPMRDARGDSALLVTQIRLASLQGSLRPAGLPDLPDGSTITVISEKGVVLARSPDAERWVGRDVSASRPARTSSYHDSGTGELESDDGVHRLIAFSRLESAPWRVYTGVPMSAIYAQARWDFGRALGYGGLALALGLGLATWQASRIIDPLTRLSADAAKLGTGNLSHRTGVLGADELGILGSTINQMAATLEQQGAGLRESEERYRELFDINPLPMWVFDADTLAFLAVNRAAIHAYGYSEQEFLAMKITEIRPQEDIPILMTQLQAISEVTRLYPTRHQRKDGTIIHVEIASGVITFGGRPARMVVVNDVSDRVRAEDALREAELHLRQSQRLEAVGQLTGGIAHDFNNVLTAIGSYSDFLYESLDADDARRLDIQEIRKAADRAAGLTRQLLAFSRSQILQPKVLDVNDSLVELESLLKRLLPADLQLVLALDPEVGHVRADPGQLSQVIINLAVNARDAMPHGGALTILTRNELVTKPVAADDHLSVKPGEYVAIDVSDTGTGMDEDTLQRIFEPFFTTKSPGAGTGLGLATVHGIVLQSGGYICADSRVGSGTTFTIRFPRVDQPVESERVPPEQAAAAIGSETILVVEDEEAVRRAAKRILAGKGYTVLEAGSGTEAMEVIDSNRGIDLLLTDLVMPGMGGRELVRVLREQNRSIATLYMSGYTKDAVMRAELDPDIMVLEKPFSQEDLAAKVREALDKAGNV